MIVHIPQQEITIIRRQLLTDVVYAITHAALKPMNPEHTTLTPVEIYMSAQNLAKTINKLSDVDEGLDDEIDDLIAEASSEDEAMFIMLLAAIMLQALDKKQPTQQTNDTILHIFQRCQENELFAPLLTQFANREEARYAAGKITDLLNYELAEIVRNKEDLEAIRTIINGLLVNADKMDVETIRGMLISFNKFNLDNNHVIDGELIRLYDKLDYRSTNVADLKEYVASNSRYPREKDYQGVAIWLDQQKKKGVDFYAAAGYNRSEMCRKLSKLFDWDVKENSLRKAQEELKK